MPQKKLKEKKLFSNSIQLEAHQAEVNSGKFSHNGEYFATAGSYTQPTTTHVFRYQKGDFVLIGKDVLELERTTGKTVTTSDNYLTHKRIVITERPKRKAITKRTRLPKSALKPLGFNLDD